MERNPCLQYLDNGVQLIWRSLQDLPNHQIKTPPNKPHIRYMFVYMFVYVCVRVCVRVCMCVCVSVCVIAGNSMILLYCSHSITLLTVNTSQLVTMFTCYVNIYHMMLWVELPSVVTGHSITHCSHSICCYKLPSFI